MTDAVNQYERILKELNESGAIEFPLSIQADLGERIISADLLANGSVLFDGKDYSDLELAMRSINRDTHSTSSPWQFWACFSTQRNAWVPLEHLRAELESKDSIDHIKTSETHPLRIDFVSYPAGNGKIGLTFFPGKSSIGLYGGQWSRNLALDLEAISDWGATALITLTETHEFALLNVPDFTSAMENSKLRWFHLPIQDMQTPSDDFEERWYKVGNEIHELLTSGERIVIHCRGGLGRTGLLAARILVEANINPVDAVAMVRAARPHSIETYAQEHYVLTKAWQKN